MAEFAYTGIEFRPVNYERLAVARTAMKLGCSLSETAASLGVRPRDLDLALWRWLGVETPLGRSAPMFEG